MDRFAPRKLIRWFAPLIAVIALWLGYRHFTDAPDTPAAREAESLLPKRRAPVVFRDGRWVTLSPAEWDAFVRERSHRAHGLLQVRGVVRQSDTGEPVPGAEVVFAGEIGESTIVADSQGAYTLEIPPGFYRAFARADGYIAVGTAPIERLPAEPDPTAVGMPKSELAPALAVFRDLTSVDMFLQRGAEIYGTVYDQNGVPVAGAIVVGRQTGYVEWRTRLVLGTDMDETGLDGTFRLQVPAGNVWLQASHSEFAGLAADSAQYLLVTAGDRMRVDLTMQRGCIITGQVIDQRGALAGEGSLEVWTGGEPPNDYIPVGKVEEGGRFRLTRTEPGTVRLRAWPWKSPPSGPQELSCQEGTRHTGITLVVPEAEPDVQGMVLSASGEPMPFAYLDLAPLSPGGMAQQERADAYGEWAFFSLPPGEYQVTASVAGHGAAAQVVTAPSRGNRLVLSGTGSLRGAVNGLFEGSFTFRIERCTLTTEDGMPAQINEFTLPQATRLVTIERGRYQIDDLPACPLVANVTAKDRSWPIEVEIAAGRVAELDLDLREPRRKRVFGQVTDANRQPAVGAMIVRVPGPGAPRDESFYAESDAQGAYEVEAYSGDTLRVRGDAGWAEVSVSWEEGDSERIDIALEP